MSILLLGFKMAKFRNGSWLGTHYKVRPLGWRRLFSWLFVFPYFAGNRVKFRLEVTKRESPKSPRLNQLEIYEVTPGYDKRWVPTIANCRNDQIICSFINERVIPRAGKVEYWLGVPDGIDSYPLITTEVYYSDKAILWATQTLLGALIGTGIGAIIIWLISRY